MDEHENDKEDWTVYRQIAITITMYFHMATIWLLKKPGFHHDGVQFLLKFITYINAYNLVFSLIFETSHFLQLLVDDSSQSDLTQVIAASPNEGNQSYFLVSFSTSFAIAHSNLWFLSQFWEWTQKKYNQNKMSSDSKHSSYGMTQLHRNSHYQGMGKTAIALETPHHKQISILRDEHNIFY